MTEAEAMNTPALSLLDDEEGSDADHFGSGLVQEWSSPLRQSNGSAPDEHAPSTPLSSSTGGVSGEAGSIAAVDSEAPHSIEWNEEEQASMTRGRTRSRSFYTSAEAEEANSGNGSNQEAEVHTQSGALSSATIQLEEPADRHVEMRVTRSRSRSMVQRDGGPTVSPPKQGSESRLLKAREKKALEQGLEDAARVASEKGRGRKNSRLDSDSDVEGGYADREREHVVRQRTTKLKFLMLGDVAVGKTSLMKRWTSNTFEENMISTAGVDFSTKNLSVDEKKVTVQLWDTAGQERFHVITHSYYRGCNGIILVYDTTIESEAAVKRLDYWLSNIRAHANKNIVVAIVCNKIDLLENEEAAKSHASLAVARKLAKEQGIRHYLTSAKTAKGVDEAFMSVVTKVMSEQAKAAALTQAIAAEADIPGGDHDGVSVKACAPTCTVS